MERPEIRYVDGPDGYVAYAVVGSGTDAVVYCGSWSHGFELLWESPAAQRFLRRLSSCGRLVLFDRRGAGLSDPLPRPYLEPGDFTATIEEGVRDLVLVLDDIGVERASLVANYAGTTLAIQAAAVRPERVTSLVLIDPAAAFLNRPEHPWGWTVEFRQAAEQLIRSTWGTGVLSASLVPSVAPEAAFLEWLGRSERYGCPRGVMARYWSHLDFDLRPLLGSIRCPTLVLSHEQNRFYSPEAASFVAAQIPLAVGPEPIAGQDLEIYAPQPAELLARIEQFLRGHDADRADAEEEGTRSFAVIVFTDLVDSTRKAAEMGDRRWREALDVHESVLRQHLARFGGRFVNGTGDGVLATFDAPARAVRCAAAILADLELAGLRARAGIHAGEVEQTGVDVRGLSVHIAARVLAQAAPSEVLVSRTVRDLVVGSPLTFLSRGTHVLKGVPDEWQLYALAGTAAGVVAATGTGRARQQEHPTRVPDQDRGSLR